MKKLSIFEALEGKIGDDVPIVSLTKATLVHLSHTLEDFVLRRKLPAFIFTGFQESSHWRKETERYQALADTAMQVCIFAGKPLPPDSNSKAVQIELTGDDPLRQEWFLGIFSTEFSVILCGLDNLNDPLDEAHRRFDTIWSFEPSVINKVLDVLEQILDTYRPGVLPKLQQARQQFPPQPPTSDILTRFTTELIQFEDNLQLELSQQTEALKISEKLYRSVANHAPMAILLLDKHGHVVLATGTQIQSLFGDTIPTAGTPLKTVFNTIPNGSSIADDILSQVEHESSLNLQDGRSYELKSNGIYSRGQLTYLLCMIVDITERVRVERAHIKNQQLRDALHQEREIGALRKQMMITLSHELRTPLTVIRSASDLLSKYGRRLTPDKRKDRLKSIQRQVTHLTEMLNDIDAVVRNDNERFLPRAEPTNIRKLCDEIVFDLQQAESRDITTQYNGALDHVFVDQHWLRYIIVNLLSNALKYSHPGDSVSLRVSLQDNTLTVTVKDEGIGIPTDEQPHILEPFFRATNVGSISGSGLGLVIIQNIVKAQNGEIHIQSEEKKGTTVTLTLSVN